MIGKLTNARNSTVIIRCASNIALSDGASDLLLVFFLAHLWMVHKVLQYVEQFGR